MNFVNITNLIFIKIIINLLKNYNFHLLVLYKFDNYTNIIIKCFNIFTYYQKIYIILI